MVHFFLPPYLEVMAWVHVDVEGSPPCARNSHTATALSNNRMAVFGGSSPEVGTLGDLHVLALEGAFVY